jgi:hypothetical protein
MLVDGTNSYASNITAEKERVGLLTPKSKRRSWKPVSVEEMNMVLSIIVNMEVIHCPERERVVEDKLGELYSLLP